MKNKNQSSNDSTDDEQMQFDMSSDMPKNSAKEKVLLEEIEEFINKMQLSSEEQILRQIYPHYFMQRIKEKYLQ